MAVIIQEIEILDSEHIWLGYVFRMSDSSKDIVCKISNEQKCYERFGIYTSCKLQDFVGAEYISVNIKKSEKRDMDFLMIIEMHILTNRGIITLQLYNEHNGYYQHDFFTQSEHGTKIESL